MQMLLNITDRLRNNAYCLSLHFALSFLHSRPCFRGSLCGISMRYFSTRSFSSFHPSCYVLKPHCFVFYFTFNIGFLCFRCHLKGVHAPAPVPLISAPSDNLHPVPVSPETQASDTSYMRNYPYFKFSPKNFCILSNGIASLPPPSYRSV